MKNHLALVLTLCCEPLIVVYSMHVLICKKMAESVLEEVLSNNLTNMGNLTNLDCAVCLQTCIHPAELPCGHIFCYLCIKGIVNQGRRCAMCRQDIPVDYLEKPILLKPVDTEITSQGFEDGHLWFYEGHNGWWQYDDRTSLELESAYQKGERCCELLIAGFLYVVDFDGMLQYRRNDPSRRRRIKRDIATTTKKGIAGIKVTKNFSAVLSDTQESIPNEINQNLPVSNPPLNGFPALRNSNPGTNNSTQPVQGHQRTRDRNLSGYTRPACRATSAINSNSSSDISNSTTNYNLDSSIQNTLDWAIEQIESLNLELLNDYETILWDYGQSENNLNQTRCNRTPNNDVTYVNVSDPLIESSGIDLEESSPPVLARNNNANNNNNRSLEPHPIPSGGATPASSEVNEIDVHSSESASMRPPQPPPRHRVLTGSRSLRDFQQSSSLNCDKIFQRFPSDK